MYYWSSFKRVTVLIPVVCFIATRCQRNIDNTDGYTSKLGHVDGDGEDNTVTDQFDDPHGQIAQKTEQLSSGTTIPMKLSLSTTTDLLSAIPRIEKNGQQSNDNNKTSIGNPGHSLTDAGSRKSEKLTSDSRLRMDTILPVVKKYDFCYEKESIDTCRTQSQCFCDDDCTLFNDCCLDAKRKTNNAKEELMRSLIQSLEFVPMFDTFTYRLVTSCEPNNVHDTSSFLCTNINTTDILSMIPAYDIKLRISFRNIHCARCNNADPQNVKFWDIVLTDCDFFEYTDLDELTIFVNRLLNEPNGWCQISAKPGRGFRMIKYPLDYRDGYLCDEYNHTEGSEILIQSLVSDIPIDIATDGLSNHSTSSTPWQHLHTPVDEHVLRKACLAYNNLIKFRYFKTYSKNSICVWCLEMRGQREYTCMANSLQIGKLLSFSILINFHSALDTIREIENSTCKGNEVYDSFHNICRHLTCTARRIASFGKCQEAYSSVSIPSFAFVIYIPCMDLDYKQLKDAVRFYMERQFRSRLYFTPFDKRQSVGINESIAGQEYCSRYCAIMYIHTQLTPDDITHVNRHLQNIFGVQITNDIITLTQLEVRNKYLNCSKAIQTEQVSSMPCPYITINSSDFTLLAEALEEAAIHLPDNTSIHTNGTYLVCYSTYKTLIQSLNGNRPIYHEKQRFVKSVISLTLVSTSFITLVISSSIYIFHPDLKTLPCRISLHTMLVLIVTCILFGMANIFDSFPTVCYIVAVLSHYTWLCVFVWSVLCGFHTVVVFLKMPLARRPNLNARNPRRSWRLYIYSAIAYMTPCVVCVCTLVLDRTKTYVLDYGVPTCFINNSEALLWTFGIPVIIMLSFNTIFFVISAVKLFTFSPGGSSCVQMKTNVFAAAVKLFACLGFTWTFGIVASITDEEVLWYLHIIFNSSHGILLFLSLVVFSKTVRRLCKKKTGNNAT